MTWDELAETLVAEVCYGHFTNEEISQLTQYVKNMQFIPGGRYLYYAGRDLKAYNNCYLLKAEEDTREDWAALSWKAESCLTVGGGIGVDYSVYRPAGERLKRTGGTASGAVSKMRMIDSIGREVMQGGSRRSAIYASLNHKHGDIKEFLVSKNWQDMPVAGTNMTMFDLKMNDFNFKCPLDYTNISVNYDTAWLENYWKTGDVGEVFKQNVLQALSTAEPGFSFNFFDKEKETLRNACTEVTSEDDSDVCNLGSINLGNIGSISEFKDVVDLATKFLMCGTLYADMPYDKVGKIREKNRRLGLGIMGLHEWLLQRDYKYEMVPELHRWLTVYRDVSNNTSANFADVLGVSRPVANRAIAPTGTIGILAGTTTGIEPLFSVAYKRRYLKDGKKWVYQYVIDGTAKTLINEYDLKPDDIETSLSLSEDYEKRIKFQANVQEYVDMAISSTINLPKWGSKLNNPDTVNKFTTTLAEYAHRLRGFTCYPDGARGGQPLTIVSYEDAMKHEGKEFEELSHDICDITQRGGTCGV
jgi:ribonucleoside-diphosphate reductase alpha chain